MLTPAPPQQTDALLNHVRAGGRLVVRTPLRITIIDAKALAAWERAGQWLIKAQGDGYRLRSGKSSVYLFPGQLEIEGRS